MTLVVGPLLNEVLLAQDADEQMLRFPAFARWVEAVVGAAGELGVPVLWPVGPVAQQLAGGAVLASAGQVSVWSGHSGLDGQPVALLAVNLVSPIPVRHAIRTARSLGAGRVVLIAHAVAGVENQSDLGRVVHLGGNGSVAGTTASSSRSVARVLHRRSA